MITDSNILICEALIVSCVTFDKKVQTRTVKFQISGWPMTNKVIQEKNTKTTATA